MGNEHLGGWQEHELQRARAWLKTSYAERLRWLEDAKRFAHMALQAAAKRQAVGVARQADGQNNRK